VASLWLDVKGAEQKFLTYLLTYEHTTYVCMSVWLMYVCMYGREPLEISSTGLYSWMSSN